MKRPIVVMLLLWSIGLFLWMKAIPFLLATLILFFILYVSTTKKLKKSHILICLGICFISVVRLVYYDYTYTREKTYVESNIPTVTGYVQSVKGKEYGYEYIITDWKTGQISHNASGKLDNNNHVFVGRYNIKVISKTQVMIGDYVSLTLKLRPIEGNRNIGGFDGASYYKQKAIVAISNGKLSLVESKKAFKVKRWMYSLRDEHYRVIKELLPKESSSIIGTLLLGLDSVDDDIEEGFRAAGLIHILAISGLHVSIITLGLFNLTKRLIPIKYAAYTTIVIACSYCLYTGGHTSTVRATMMVIMYLLQYIITRRYDPSTALSTVALTLLVYNPYMIMNVGFLLSFIAVASLFYITPRLKDSILPQEGYMWDQLRTMIGVQIGLTPVLAYYFHTISLYGIVANFLVLPVVSIILLFSLMGLMLAYVSMPLARFVMGTVFWLLNYTLQVVKLINEMPFNQVLISGVSLLSLGLFSIVLILWIHKYNWRWLCAIMVLILLVSGYSRYKEYNQLTIHHMDVGQGDSAILTYKDRCIIIDGGGVIRENSDQNTGTLVIKPFLDFKGIKEIDTVFISHSDYDHIYGIIEIAKLYPIRRVILSDYEQSHKDRPMLQQLLMILSDNEFTEVVYMSEGESISYDDLHFISTGPLGDKVYDNPNDGSLTLLLSYNQYQELFLGDISIDQELDLLKTLDAKVLSGIEVIKVAHHGSSSSSTESFYQTIQAHLSIVSVGKNTYGQPDDEVLKILNKHCQLVRTTLENGAVIVSTDGKSMEVDTMLK